MAGRPYQVQEQVVHHKARVMIQNLRTAFDLVLLKAEAADQLEFNEACQRDARGVSQMAMSRNPTFAGVNSRRLLEKFVKEKYNAQSARIAAAETMSSLNDFVRISKDPKFYKEAVTQEIAELRRAYFKYLGDYERKHPGVRLNGMDRMQKEMRYILEVPGREGDSKEFDLEEYYAEDEEVLEDSLGKGIVGAVAGFYKQLGDVEATERLYEQDPDFKPPPLASLSEDGLSAEQEQVLKRYMETMKGPLRLLEADLKTAKQNLKRTLQPLVSPEDFVDRYDKKKIRNPTHEQKYYAEYILSLQRKIQRQKQSIQNRCLLQEFVHGKEMESATNDPWSDGTGKSGSVEPAHQPAHVPAPDAASAEFASCQERLKWSLQRHYKWEDYLSHLYTGTVIHVMSAIDNENIFKLTEKFLIGAIEQSIGKGIDVKDQWARMNCHSSNLQAIKAKMIKIFPRYEIEPTVWAVLRCQLVSGMDEWDRESYCKYAIFYLKRSLHVVLRRITEPTFR